MRARVFAVVLAGCYAPTPAPGVPCSERFTCPGAQVCDRSVTPPTCREPGSGGPDAAMDTAADDAPIGAWRAPVLVMPPVGEEDDPTLTWDMLELVFNRNNNAIWRVRRKSATAPWGAPVQVAELGVATTPEMTADGRTIYLGSERGGLPDIWVSTRVDPDATWSQPVRDAELSTPGAEETNATPSRDHLSILLSRRVIGRSTEIFAASRAALGAPWGTASRLTELNTVQADGDAMLSADELAIYFYSTRAGMGDLYVATRASRSEPFGAPEPIDELNDPAALDQDPWISPDGRTLFFASDRGGQMAIYMTTR